VGRGGNAEKERAKMAVKLFNCRFLLLNLVGDDRRGWEGAIKCVRGGGGGGYGCV
jgi:hypothetical protein